MARRHVGKKCYDNANPASSGKFSAKKKWTFEKSAEQDFSLRLGNRLNNSNMKTARNNVGQIPSRQVFEAAAPICSPPASTGLGFLDLPAEIRNMIYRSVLLFNGIQPLIQNIRTRPRESHRDFHSCMKICMLSPSALETKYNEFNATAHGDCLAVQKAFALTFTCKQIRKEAREIFWSENTFIFDSLSQRNEFLRHLDQKRKDLIMKIGVRLTSWEYAYHNFPISCEELLHEVLLPDCALGRFGDYPVLSPKAYILRDLKEKSAIEAGGTEEMFTSSSVQVNRWPRTPYRRDISLQHRNTHSPTRGPVGSIKQGSIFDMSATGPLADYKTDRRTMLDVLGDCIRYDRKADTSGWKFAIERRKRDREDVPWPGSNCLYDVSKPYMLLYLWTERDPTV
ncbi:MAG: hypothetical protein Q9191_002847 [Dirinaria sp. TL-2023a]